MHYLGISWTEGEVSQNGFVTCLRVGGLHGGPQSQTRKKHIGQPTKTKTNNQRENVNRNFVLLQFLDCPMCEWYSSLILFYKVGYLYLDYEAVK